MDLKQQAIEQIRNSPFNKCEKMFTDLLRPAIRIFASNNMVPGGTGQSKLGGNPDLPKDWDWPLYEGQPLNFLLQINLADVKPYDLENLLPASGHLYFFVNNYYVTLDRRGAVLYFDGDRQLLHPKKNPANPSDLDGTPLQFELYYMLPRGLITDFNDPLNISAHLECEEEYPEPYDDENSGGDIDGYFDVLSSLMGQNGSSHLLGYIEPFQQDEIDDQHQLLLQLIEGSGEGTVYYSIGKQDLKDKQFSKASPSASFF